MDSSPSRLPGLIKVAAYVNAAGGPRGERVVTTVTHLVPLELLAAGEVARIREVDGTPEFVHRLAEMGLQIGSSIRMIQPGSPCILAVGNHRFSLRIEDSAVVLVEMQT